jgi:glucosylceramidase
MTPAFPVTTRRRSAALVGAGLAAVLCTVACSVPKANPQAASVAAQRGDADAGPAGEAARAVGQLTAYPTAAGVAPGAVITGLVSSPKGGELVVDKGAPAKKGALTVTVDAATTRGPWVGVGAALTDSTVDLLQHAQPKVAAEALRRLADPVKGAGMTVVMLPQSATDFSSEMWTADKPGKAAAQAEDWARALTAVQPVTTVDLSNWSPNKALKQTARLEGGAITDQAVVDVPAQLTARAKALAEGGLRIRSVTVQNEPQNDDVTMPSAWWTTQQQQRAAATLTVDLKANFPNGTPLVYVHEHNVDRAADAATLAKGVPGSAVSWHCYKGEGDALAAAIRALPAGVQTSLTECSGEVGREHQFFDDLTFALHDWALPGMGAGANEVRYWNAVLDSRGGPQRGGCSRCEGLLTIDAETGELSTGAWWTALAHIGRVVAPGAGLRHVTVDGAPEVVAVGAVNLDGTTSIVASNSGDADRTFLLPLTNVQVTVPAHGAGSWRWMPTG